MDCRSFAEAVVDLLNDGLDPKLLGPFTAHFKSCPERRALYARRRDVAIALDDASIPKPDAATRQKMMKEAVDRICGKPAGDFASFVQKLREHLQRQRLAAAAAQPRRIESFIEKLRFENPKYYVVAYLSEDKRTLRIDFMDERTRTLSRELDGMIVLAEPSKVSKLISSGGVELPPDIFLAEGEPSITVIGKTGDRHRILGPGA